MNCVDFSYMFLNHKSAGTRFTITGGLMATGQLINKYIIIIIIIKYVGDPDWLTAGLLGSVKAFSVIMYSHI